MNIINLKCTCGQYMICDTDYEFCCQKNMPPTNFDIKTTPPPIHSDPAGEPFMIEVRYADLQKLHARIKELEQPQTGRTYTEGLNEFLDFLVWYGTIEEKDREDHIETYHRYKSDKP